MDACRDSSVGIATRYELGGPWIESRCGRDFPHPPDQLWGPPNLLHNRYRVLPVGKATRAWRWLPTPSSAEVKERVELYLYSPSGPSWHVLGWPLPLPSIISIRNLCLPVLYLTVWWKLRTILFRFVLFSWKTVSSHWGIVLVWCFSKIDFWGWFGFRGRGGEGGGGNKRMEKTV